MAYRVIHLDHAEEAGVPVSRFADLLAELDGIEDDDREVALAHDSGWTLRIVRSGMVYFESVNAGAPWEAGPFERSQILSLMTSLANGRLEDVSPRFTRQGYPPRRPVAEVDAVLFGDVAAAVRRAVRAFLDARPGQQLAGFALLTDGGLETLLGMAITTDAVASSEDPDIVWAPTDWGDEVEVDDPGLDRLGRYLRDARQVRGFDAHVDSSFVTLVEALAALKREGLFAAGTFLLVSSTDPSPYQESLYRWSIRTLNEPSIVDGFARYIARWSGGAVQP